MNIGHSVLSYLFCFMASGSCDGVTIPHSWRPALVVATSKNPMQCKCITNVACDLYRAQFELAAACSVSAEASTGTSIASLGDDDNCLPGYARYYMSAECMKAYANVLGVSADYAAEAAAAFDTINSACNQITAKVRCTHMSNAATLLGR